MMKHYIRIILANKIGEWPKFRCPCSGLNDLLIGTTKT